MSVEPKAKAVVWIASYPKSGNTWLQNVVRRAGRRHGFPSVDLDVYKLLAEKRPPAIVSGVRPRVSAEPTTVLKTHLAYKDGGQLHPELGLKTAGVVYIMRNPLDMLLSYINFTRQQYAKRADSPDYQKRLFIDLLGFDKPFTFEEWQAMRLETIPRQNLDHALERFSERETTIPGLMGTTKSSWLAHCRSWQDAATKMPSAVLRYENLLKGPEEFFPLTKLFKFDQEELTQAVTWVNEQLRANKGSQVFFNKMTSHYFREFFSPDVIARFLEKYEADLKAVGYGDLY